MNSRMFPFFSFSLFFFSGGFWVGWRNCAFVCMYSFGYGFLGRKRNGAFRGRGAMVQKTYVITDSGVVGLRVRVFFLDG